MRIDPPALRAVAAALVEYQRAVEKSDLTDRTKATYTRHAHNFVRWCMEEFEPGARKRTKR